MSSPLILLLEHDVGVVLKITTAILGCAVSWFKISLEDISLFLDISLSWCEIRFVFFHFPVHFPTS